MLRDLTRSFREGNWLVHLASIDRAIPFYFTSDKVNYKRCLPIYYEDCLQLPQKYHDLYASFMEGNFVVHHTTRKGSAVLMDQAFEKAYNKVAISQSGIIGFSH